MPPGSPIPVCTGTSLTAFGLIKASFVREDKIQELRSLMRARKQLVREQTRHIQRIQKTLEEANPRLHEGKHQARFCGQRHHGPVRAADDRGISRRATARRAT